MSYPLPFIYGSLEPPSGGGGGNQNLTPFIRFTSATGISEDLNQITDGAGNNLPLFISSNSIKLSGNLIVENGSFAAQNILRNKIQFGGSVENPLAGFIGSYSSDGLNNPSMCIVTQPNSSFLRFGKIVNTATLQYDTYMFLNVDSEAAFGLYLKDGSFIGDTTLNTNGVGLSFVSKVKFSHDVNFASKVGFFGSTPIAQQPGGAATAGLSYTINERDMLNKSYSALRNYGLITF